MKRLIQIIVCFNIFVTSLLSQNCDTTGLGKIKVKKLIYQQFGNLINSHSNNNIGNYASIDLKEAEVKIVGNVIFNNGSILGLKVNGAISDGYLPVFSNDVFNTKFGIEAQYNFLDFQKKKILYDNETCKKYRIKKKKILQEYDIREIEIINKYEKIKFFIEIEKSEKDLKVLKNKINSIVGYSKDSLEIEIEKAEAILKFQKEREKDLPTMCQQKHALNNWKSSELKKNKNILEVYGFKFGWFSLGYGISNNSFILFNSTLQFNEQKSKESYLSHTIRLQYNYYSKNPFAYESFFFSLGGSLAYTDNFSSLNKVEINERYNFGTNEDDRYIIKKYNAYKGDYSKGLMSKSLFLDFYWFLFEDNKGALHFYPEYKMKENLKPSTNLGFGFLLAFKDKSNMENIINSEIYINFKDISNKNESSENLIVRSEYGIRFTFPINFNY